MAKPEWGKKRICPSCGLKYYDFNNSPITCPKCKVEFDPDVYLRSRKGKSLSTKIVSENNDDISIIDEIEIEADEEVVTDDDPILDINKDDKETDTEVEIEDEISFIDEDEISEDDNVTVEVIDDNKD